MDDKYGMTSVNPSSSTPEQKKNFCRGKGRYSWGYMWYKYPSKKNDTNIILDIVVTNDPLEIEKQNEEEKEVKLMMKTIQRNRKEIKMKIKEMKKKMRNMKLKGMEKRDEEEKEKVENDKGEEEEKVEEEGRKEESISKNEEDQR